MLRSSGYFNNINCPYFTSGFCERPHCHFKHVKKDLSSVTPDDEPATVDSKADLLKIYSDTLRKIQEAEKELLATSTPPVDTPSVVTYIPTPKNANPRRSSLESHIPAMCMPEYKPTPISQLRRLNKDSPDYSTSVSSYKRKVNEWYSDCSSQPSGKVSKRVEEYDPTKVAPTVNCKYPSKVSDSGSECEDIHANAHFSDSDDERSSKKTENCVPSKLPRLQKQSTTPEVVLEPSKSDTKFDVVSQILQESKTSEDLIKNWTNTKDSQDSSKPDPVNPSVKSADNLLQEPSKKVVRKTTKDGKFCSDKSAESVCVNKETEENERSAKRLKTVDTRTDKSDSKSNSRDEVVKDKVTSKSSVKKDKDVRHSNNVKDRTGKANHKHDQNHSTGTSVKEKAASKLNHSHEKVGKSRSDGNDIKEKSSVKSVVSSEKKEKKEKIHTDGNHLKEKSLNKTNQCSDKPEKVSSERNHLKEKLPNKSSLNSEKQDRNHSDENHLKEKLTNKTNHSSEKRERKHFDGNDSKEKLPSKCTESHEDSAKSTTDGFATRERLTSKSVTTTSDNTNNKSTVNDNLNLNSGTNEIHNHEHRTVVNNINSKRVDQTSSDAMLADKSELSPFDSLCKMPSVNSVNNVSSKKSSSHKSSSTCSSSKKSSHKSLSHKSTSNSSHKISPKKSSSSHKSTKSSDSKSHKSSSNNSSSSHSKNSHRSSSSKPSSRSSSKSSPKKSAKHSSSSKSIKSHKSGSVDHKSSNSKSHQSSNEKKHKKSSSKSTENSHEKGNDNKVSLNGKDEVASDVPTESFSAEDYAWFEEMAADLDNHDELEECWKIFNEENPSMNLQMDLLGQKPKSSHQQEKQKSTSSSSQELLHSRKRVAHNPSSIAMTEQSFHKAPAARKTFASAAQAMADRFKRLQEAYIRHAEHTSKSSAFGGLLPRHRSEHRVAAVPNAALLAAMSPPRRNSVTSNNSFSTAGPNITVAATVGKGERRIAHLPIVAQSKRPVIPASYGNKVPLNVRQRYLNLFIDECLKFAASEEAAYAKALEEESAAYERSSNKNVYLNVVINIVKRLRVEAEAGPPPPPAPISPPLILRESPPRQQAPPPPQREKKRPQLAQRRPTSHQAMLGGARAAKTSFSIERNRPKPQKEESLKGVVLYKLMSKYVLSSEMLVENGFPQPNPDCPGKAIIHGLVAKKTYNSSSLHRQCSRCQTFYLVDENGLHIRQEECVYHWGNIWKKRIAGSIESRYSCCEGDAESEGCCVGEGHVVDNYDPDKITGFVQTLDKPSLDGNYGVYALDCEMCYTTQGIELTRLTVIGEDLKPIYETMVKPENPVLDYNTRFSGITKEDLQGVYTSLRDVQAVLLSLFSKKTILLGHSLDSDFKALRLIHPTVVDTVVVFPHRRGPPFRRALRTLMAEFLNKIIQNSEGGHDSQEDAVACLELMIWKIKEDVKCLR